MFLKSNDENNLYLDKLVSESCLLLGQKCTSKINNEKNYFILGRRNSVEVLNKNKIKFLLFRLYPIISGFYRNSIKKNDVKILFATTNTVYKKIVEDAAIQCGMPFYSDRWLCGSITGTLQNTELNRVFNVKKTREETYSENFYQRVYKPEIDIKKLQTSKDNRWFSLAIIPDVQNNSMILRELKNSYIPTSGIVDTNSINEVTYPIFGNNSSLYAVSFFCNLVSKIISSEKNTFSLKKKYQMFNGRKNKKKQKKIITIKRGGGYFFYRRKKKNYKTFWKFLRTYVFPQKNTPKLVKKIVRKKLNMRLYYKKKIAEMTNSLKEKKFLKKKIIKSKKDVIKPPFAYFTRKDFVSSMLISKKRTNLRRLFKSIIFLKSQNTLKMWSSKNSWLINEKTKTRFLPISKKLFFGFKKLKKKKLYLNKKVSKAFKRKNNAILIKYTKAIKRSFVVSHYLRKPKGLQNNKKKYYLNHTNNSIRRALNTALKKNLNMKYFYFLHLNFLSQKARLKLLKTLNVYAKENNLKKTKNKRNLKKKYQFFLNQILKVRNNYI